MSGEVIIPVKYERVKWLQDVVGEGTISAAINNHQNLYFDINGKIIEELSKYEYVGYNENGTAIVWMNGKCGLIDKSKKLILPCLYDNIGESYWGFASITAVVKNGKYGLINLSGKLVVPCVYDEISYFNGGMARVRKNGKYGFINFSGKLVIPAIYDEVEPFKVGCDYVEVVKNGETFAIDRTGKIIEDYYW